MNISTHDTSHGTTERPDFIQLGVSLAGFNTFRFAAHAEYFALVENIESLRAAIYWAQSHKLPVTVIGGGSNLLISADIPGLVIVNRLSGIELVSEDDTSVLVAVAAGENWHNFVDYSVQQAWYGVENLALIPGTVGAAPVQNIGAYGVEVKDVVKRVQVLDLANDTLLWLDAEECGFAYRDSHFKGKWKQAYIITCVEFHLSRQAHFILSYGGLQGQLEGEVTLAAVFNAVCRVRRSKLPDPDLIANAGSFFKNPVISASEHDALKNAFPNLVSFVVDDGVKLAAGWLIDQAGWKGVRHLGVGVYDKQALVLVNYSETQATALLELETLIQKSVFEKYGVCLEREPVILPNLKPLAVTPKGPQL